nr:hemagglutinin repeat-containing protein [Rhodoferax sp.]
MTASNTLTVKSGADTTLAGAQLAADQVKMEVGTSGTGKLNIQTLQDSSTYSSEQSSSGFSVSVCLPPLCVGGVPVTGSIQQSEQAFNHNQSRFYAAPPVDQFSTEINTARKFLGINPCLNIQAISLVRWQAIDSI